MDMKTTAAILALHLLVIGGSALAERPAQTPAAEQGAQPGGTLPKGEQERAQAAFKNGRYREAAVRYERLHHRQPKNLEIRLQLAKSYQLRGQLDQAEAHAKAILTHKPNHLGALLLMGQLSARHERWQAAHDYYERAAKADASDATAQLGLGNALTHLGDEEGASAAFARYQTLTNTNER